MKNRLFYAWKSFWFKYHIEEIHLSLFKFGFCVTAFIMYLVRALDKELLYFGSGYMPEKFISLYFEEAYKPLFFWYPKSDSMVIVVQVLFLLLLLLIALGFLSRFWSWLALFFHLSLLQKNPTVLYGADYIVTLGLLYLGFIDSKAIYKFNWSKLWQKKVSFHQWLTESHSDWLKDDVLTSMGIRLFQVHISLIYMYTGLEKLRGSSWWDGSVLWTLFNNEQIFQYKAQFLGNYPLLMAIMSWSVLLFEVYFIVLVFSSRHKNKVLLFGIGFHIVVAFTMALPYFSFLMLSSYLLFINNNIGKRNSTFSM